MKNSIILFVIFGIVALFSVSSCKKDSVTDPRDKIIGTYNLTNTVLKKNSEMTPNTNTNDTTVIESRTLTVYKDTFNNQGLIFKETNPNDLSNFTFKIVSFKVVSNGIAFNILSLSGIQDGFTETWQGNSGYNIDGQKYDGVYLNGTNTITFGSKGIYLIIYKGITYSMPFVSESEAKRI